MFIQRKLTIFALLSASCLSLPLRGIDCTSRSLANLSPLPKSMHHSIPIVLEDGSMLATLDLSSSDIVDGSGFTKIKKGTGAVYEDVGLGSDQKYLGDNKYFYRHPFLLGKDLYYQAALREAPKDQGRVWDLYLYHFDLKQKPTNLTHFVEYNRAKGGSHEKTDVIMKRSMADISGVSLIKSRGILLFEVTVDTDIHSEIWSYSTDDSKVIPRFGTHFPTMDATNHWDAKDAQILSDENATVAVSSNVVSIDIIGF